MSDGIRMRTARKHHQCDGYLPHPEHEHLKGAPCMRGIVAGEAYGEGGVNPDRAGGFGHYRYCESCVAQIASHPLAAA